MKKSDMDCIMKFALASSATLIIASCSTGCVYGPPPTDCQPWDDPDVLGTELESVPIPQNSHDIQDSDKGQSTDDD